MATNLLEKIGNKFGKEIFIGKYSNIKKNIINDDFEIIENNEIMNSFYSSTLTHISDKYNLSSSLMNKNDIILEFRSNLLKEITSNRILNILSSDNISFDILYHVSKYINKTLYIFSESETNNELPINSFKNKYNQILEGNIEISFNIMLINPKEDNEYILYFRQNNIYYPILFKNNNKLNDFITYINLSQS